MAPVTQLGLVVLATASVALAERHAHARGHRHLNRRQNRPYLTAPYGFTNGTVTVGPTATGVSSDGTSTRTRTLTSTVTQTLTAGGEGELPVEGDSVPSCGATVYVTATNTVTVTASASSASSASPETTASYGDDGDEEETPAPTTPSSTYSAPAASSPVGYAAQSPAETTSTSAAAPVAPASSSSSSSSSSPPSSSPSSSSSEAPVYTAPTSYEAPASSSSAQSTTVDTTSSTSSAASSPTGYSGGSTGSTGLKTKRGCLYESGKNDCSELASQGKLSWITNWAASPAGDSAGLVYIPQLWGQTKVDTATGKVHDYTVGFKDACKKAIDAGAPAVLGFNEPNIASQAGLDAVTAASVWNEHIAPFGKSGAGKMLVSPGVTSESSGPVGQRDFPGLNWLKSFKAQPGVDWDATAVHFYANCNQDDQMDYLKEIVEAANTMFGKPVWVTEYGCAPEMPSPADKQAAFMQASIEYLESKDFVQQYAAFKADTLAGTGAGSTYAALDSKTPS
ncbi:AmmeMemoRadiSam system protein B [Sphaceloma murrayae]|uniref:AmmeMemoRadiSam system protein B n=1 Tax=Sphaceloma murrayae TaxID=2082308 RepID=A0A2K1QFC3_9PEZI|nr:AmmeMemoRadiSam system protein B [Sphaceloma murrayae]